MGTAHFDVVVIGSGAGGGLAAASLASRGWNVALLEKGRNPYPHLGDPVLTGSDFGNDEIRRRRFFGFHDPFIEPRTFRDSPTGEARTTDVQGLGVCVGGGTVQYDADSPRLQRVDLRRLSSFGPIEGASVVDWPIDYDELIPFYDEAERITGVQGLAGADPFAEPRSPYPMRPGPPSKAGLVLSAGARSLGYHPHPMPMAINSTTYRGRPACVNCGFCNVGCPVNAKGSTAVTAVRDALLTGNCTLLSECCVTRIDTEASGTHASAVRYIDAHGDAQSLTAEHVIVAANAIETPRLLLASANAAHPDGLGNGSGLVGRHLMFHVVIAAIGVFPEELRSYRGRVITHAMSDFTHVAPAPGALRGGYVELGGSEHPVEEGVLYPWRLAKSLMTEGTYRRRIAAVGMIGEDAPVADNRVELDPRVRDVYGRPVARVTYQRHAADQRLVDAYMPRLVEIARASGATDVLEIDFAVRDGVPSTRHLHGTTRMGIDPAASVTDPWGRLHEVDNVWICDGGTWPTSSSFNPTLTQQALALRTAAHLDALHPRT